MNALNTETTHSSVAQAAQGAEDDDVGLILQMHHFESIPMPCLREVKGGMRAQFLIAL